MPSKHRPRRPAEVARSRCRQCDCEPTKDNPISARLLCRTCAIENIAEPGLQMQRREGPYYDQWLSSTLDALHRLARR